MTAADSHTAVLAVARAASANGSGALWLAVVGALAVLGVLYLVGCRIWPYGRCVRCMGSGRNRGSNSRRWGRCKRCGASGQRLRAGTRLMRKFRAGL